MNDIAFKMIFLYNVKKQVGISMGKLRQVHADQIHKLQIEGDRKGTF